MKELILKIYMSLFGLIVNRPSNSQHVERLVHAHFASMVSTGVLMWAYAFLAYFTIASPVPGIVGFAASTVHLLSPLLYKKTTNHLFNTSVLLGAGIVHQMTFAFYTGGFDSNILIWLGILPMLAGVMAGRRGAILWAAITTICITGFMILKLSGFHFPDLISPHGKFIAQSLILFGWVFISSSVIWVHVLLEEKAAQRLEASRGRTQNLLNIFSHDISTPLSVISGRLAYLLKSPLDEGQMNSVSKAYKASQHLNEITTNLRELRLNELGRMEIRYSKVDVREMILELKDSFAEKLDQKNLKLNWSVASEVYEFHTSRSLILNQILGNLLSNAIKFSESGSEIRLRVSKLEGQIQFILEDNGVGIPKDMRDHVFEANLSRSCPGTSGETGTGFGLPIVKGCIDRLNGKISFTTRTSNEGPPGTTFKLIFPAAKAVL